MKGPRHVRVVYMGEMRNSYNHVVGNTEGNIPVVRHSYIWENNIKIHLKEKICEDLDWIHMGEDRDQWSFMNTVMNLSVP
jgi:hypothetical protein